VSESATPVPARRLISLPDAAISRRLQERIADVLTTLPAYEEHADLRFESSPRVATTGQPVERRCDLTDQRLLLIEEPTVRHLRDSARTSHWRSLIRR
jgi:hypothetical protein